MFFAIVVILHFVGTVFSMDNKGILTKEDIQWANQATTGFEQFNSDRLMQCYGFEANTTFRILPQKYIDYPATNKLTHLKHACSWLNYFSENGINGNWGYSALIQAIDTLTKQHGLTSSEKDMFFFKLTDYMYRNTGNTKNDAMVCSAKQSYVNKFFCFLRPTIEDINLSYIRVCAFSCGVDSQVYLNELFRPTLYKLTDDNVYSYSHNDREIIQNKILTTLGCFSVLKKNNILIMPKVIIKYILQYTDFSWDLAQECMNFKAYYNDIGENIIDRAKDLDCDSWQIETLQTALGKHIEKK